MADAEQQATPPKREFLKDMAPWADALSKAVAGIAIALYASGFLIVSLYHSKFGFVGTNPFRPRVLAAGAWFFFFAGIPASIAASYKSISWKKIAGNSATLWLFCFSTSILVGNLLFDYTSLALPPTRPWLWLVLIVATLALIGVVNYTKIPEWLGITSSLLLTLFYVAFPVRKFFNHEFDTSCLALWFFVVAVVAISEFKIRSRENLTWSGGWSKPMPVVFGALLVFSQYVCPHLKASWGGGTPANVTVYFTKDSLLSPNKAVQAQLIEESDEGFYIVGSKEAKAIFVPRNSVALVYFLDKAADSPLLQGIK
jgi:hypothetical protein